MLDDDENETVESTHHQTIDDNENEIVESTHHQTNASSEFGNYCLK